MEHVVAAAGRAASCGSIARRRRRHRLRGPAAGVRRAGRRRRRRRPPPTTRSTSTTSAPTWPRCSSATPSRSTTPGPTRWPRRRKTDQRTARENIDDLCDAGTFVEYGALALAAAAPAPHGRGADPQVRPPTAWSRRRAASTASCSPDARRACVGAGLRLHGAGRHAGRAQPPQDRPHARDGRAVAAAGRASSPRAAAAGPAPAATAPALERRRQPVPGRHGRSSRRRSRRWPAERAGAARSASLRPLLRRQRRAARLLRRHHRHRGLEHRHGRPGHDRGRRPRRVPARGGRARSTCRWPTASSTSPSRDEAEAVARGQAVPVVLPGRAARRGSAPTSARCAAIIPENRLRVYDVRAVIDDARRHRLACSSCAAASASAWSPRWSASRAGPSASSPTTRPTSPARSTATAPTRPRASCSCCDAFDIPILVLCDTPGIMVGPEVEKTALVRHCSRLFVVGANLDGADASSIVLRKALRPRRAGHGRRQLQGAVLRRRLADRRVRRHGPRGRGQARLPQRAGGHRGPDARGAPASTSWSAPPTSRARRSTPASSFEVDDVIDPADTRHWVANGLHSVARRRPADGPAASTCGERCYLARSMTVRRP